MVCSMIPLAVSGPLVVGVVVIGAGILVTWLLRTEARDEPAEITEAQRDGDADQEPR
jgi:hypothetical protein